MCGFGRGHHLHLIDGSGFIFRAYHALPPLTRKSDGLPVGAVAGFCNMVFKLVEEARGDDALADMDRLVTERLCPAIAAAAAHAGRAVHAAGYCMGGTLLAAAAVLCGGVGLRGLA